ncbi:MAG: RHS repeat-associated core domain-containing protein [candidate division NC10 bacterium]|nr:RHS repeat-associated core domain-containing protein [candidate division NC10 bacterium]
MGGICTNRGAKSRGDGRAPTFTYDELSRRTGLARPNGVATTYSYDAASQLKSLVHAVGGAPFASFGYTYDPVGNRTAMTEGAGTNTYAYYLLNRLTQATHPQAGNPAESFSYDPVGNRLSSHLSSVHTTDAANRLLEDSNFAYTYDANGNLTSKTSRTTGEVTTYTYDAENQLIRVDRPGLVAQYHYDPLGRRIAKVVNGASTRFVYDNEDIVAEVDTTGVPRALYTHGPGIDEPLAIGRPTGTFLFHADGLGSITTLTDLSGNPVRSYTYDSFGRIVTQSGTLANSYTYTGRELDPESGLYYYRARYYDPSIGRFLSEDPLGILGGGPNLYSYVENRPVDHFDPTGLASFAACRPIRGAFARLANHCFLIVEKPGEEAKILSLFPRGNTLSDILGGGPLSLFVGRPVLNAEVDDIRNRDINLNFLARVEPPTGVCENVFADALIQTFNAYPITRYNLATQNSNTFVGDIIGRIGGTLPPGLTGAVAPGIVRQVPDFLSGP